MKNNFTTRDIAQQAGCCQRTVQRFLRLRNGRSSGWWRFSPGDALSIAETIRAEKRPRCVSRVLAASKKEALP